MYTALKLKLKADGKLYAIVGQMPDGRYKVTPMEHIVQHGLTPRPWLEYRPETVRTVYGEEVESFLAYST